MLLLIGKKEINVCFIPLQSWDEPVCTDETCQWISLKY